jgi:hypothetical protein
MPPAAAALPATVAPASVLPAALFTRTGGVAAAAINTVRIDAGELIRAAEAGVDPHGWAPGRRTGVAIPADSETTGLPRLRTELLNTLLA